MNASSLLSPDQHRGLARNLLAHAGEPGYPTKERAAQMALNHEVMAKMIEGRQSQDAPPLAPLGESFLSQKKRPSKCGCPISEKWPTIYDFVGSSV